MFFKYLVLVIFVLDFVQSACASRHSCNLTVLAPDPDSGCCGIDASARKNIPAKKFPWLALIEYKNVYDGSYEDVCTGALISGSFVLTAAICVAGLDGGKPSSVLLGEYDKSNGFRGKDCFSKGHRAIECTPGAIRIPVEKSMTHPGFQAELMENNIGLVKLTKIVDYTDYVRPLCLPHLDFTLDPPEDLNLVVAGWGVVQHNEESKHIDINLKRPINLPYWTSERCKVRWPTVNGDKHICAGGDGISGGCVCLGDAGAPALFEDHGVHQAVGIFSFGGARCAMKNSPDVFTKVFGHKSWIVDVMKLEARTKTVSNKNRCRKCRNR